MAIVFTDNFTRAPEEDPLASGWSFLDTNWAPTGGMKSNSGTAIPGASNAYYFSYWSNDTMTDDQSIYVEMSNFDSAKVLYLFLRYVDYDGDFFYAQIDSGGADFGTKGSLSGNVAFTPTDTDTYKFSVTGTEHLRFYRNNVLIYDADYGGTGPSSGSYVGIGAIGNSSDVMAITYAEGESLSPPATVNGDLFGRSLLGGKIII